MLPKQQQSAKRYSKATRVRCQINQTFFRYQRSLLILAFLMCLIESIILRQEKVTLPDVIYFGQKSAKNTHLFLHQPLKTAAKAKGNVLRRGLSKAKACRVKGGGRFLRRRVTTQAKQAKGRKLPLSFFGFACALPTFAASGQPLFDSHSWKERTQNSSYSCYYTMMAYCGLAKNRPLLLLSFCTITLYIYILIHWYEECVFS